MVCGIIGIGIKNIYQNKSDEIVIDNAKNSNAENYINRLNEIVADDVEIEKKWLINVDDIPYNLNSSDVKVYEIEQTYISFSPEIRLRKYNNGEYYEFVIKANMTEDGLQREEMSLEITEEEYNDLIRKKEGNTIFKTRYQLYDNGQIIAIDIFKEELEGLAYMEIEFANREEANNFNTPSWVIKDVTHDENYKNGYLARYGIPVE